MKKSTTTITLTFGDRCENHIGMQMVGQMLPNGYTYGDLLNAKVIFEEKGCKCDLVHLNKLLNRNHDTNSDEAYILIIRNGVNALLGDKGNSNDLFDEQIELDVDTKAFMRGRVVNKQARYNLCFADFSQEPDYDNKKGRIVNFKDIKLTNYIRKQINKLMNDDLVAEGNYYYDVNTCGIGFHGDGERRRVVGVRLGHQMPLVYQWFLKSKPCGRARRFVLNHGDMYIMSQKATGFDWKKRLVTTLRHSAGCSKYTAQKNPPKK